MSLSFGEDGKLQLTGTPVSAPKVEAPVVETPAPVADTPVADAPASDQPTQGQPTPVTFKHGEKTPDGKLIVDPNAPVDITQFESGRKLQKTLTEIQRELNAVRAEKAEAAKKAQEVDKARKFDDLKTDYLSRIQKAKTEVEKARLYGEYKDKVADLRVGEAEEKLKAFESEKEQGEIASVLGEWNDYLTETFDPSFVDFLNRAAYAQSGDDPYIFHERRQTFLNEIMIKALAGQVPNPMRNARVQEQPKVEQPKVETPTVPAPLAGSEGQLSGIDLLLHGEWDRLDAYRRNRR